MSRTEVPQSEVISVEFDGHVATVWLDRPQARNAMAPDFWDDLPAVMRSLGEDAETRAIVIAAKGDAFSVGIDLKAFGPILMNGGVDPSDEHQPASDVARRRALYRRIKDMQDTFSSIASCPQPVIAAIHGYCIGAGVDLITACDIRFAAHDAVFSVRETRIAMVADVGTLQRLPGIVDPGWLADIVYTGRDVEASEAYERGLVTRLAGDAEGVYAEAMATARAIAANSPLAVQGSKAVLRSGDDLSIEAHLDHVALWNAAFIQSNDFVEAAMAFLDKRDPKFTGE